MILKVWQVRIYRVPKGTPQAVEIWLKRVPSWVVVTCDLTLTLESDHAATLIPSIHNDWRKDGYVAYEVDGVIWQYRKHGGANKRTWEVVSSIALDIESVKFLPLTYRG